MFRDVDARNICPFSLTRDIKDTPTTSTETWYEGFIGLLDYFNKYQISSQSGIYRIIFHASNQTISYLFEKYILSQNYFARQLDA